MSGDTRELIVNADDFGQSVGVNDGVLEARARGIVTSASLMVRFAAAADAARRARSDAGLSLGLHVDLGEWRYQAGDWLPIYEVVGTDDAGAVETEVERQLEEFKRMVGRAPTHLDTHQHVHRREPVRGVLMAAARSLGIPLREHTPGVQYRGGFYGQTGEGEPLPEAITEEALLAMLDSLEPGTTEIGCHPGRADDLDTMYRAERLQELRVLCAPRIRARIATLGIRLRTFAELGAGA